MRWLIAAGGTGGHVFPALGVARALEDREPGVQVLFVGSRRGLEERVIPSQGFSLRTLAARGLMGLGWRGKLRSLMGLPWTAMQCLSILASFRPHLVLGMGGFVSGPMVLLAALLGLPTAIAEQNAVAGRTNKMLGRFAGRVFLTFPESAQAFPPGKVRLTGNPVRPELLKEAALAKPPAWTPGSEIHLLVFGGSQGAQGINRIMMDALPHLTALPLILRVLHQSAPGQIPALREAYAAAGIAHELVDFIHHMERAYLWAHLVICRAGSASLAEVALFRRPAILIPFPHAVDDHQALNAKAFEAAGAALLFRQEGLTGERLASILDDLLKEPGRLAEMGERAGALARPDAAQRMVEECVGLLKGREAHG